MTLLIFDYIEVGMFYGSERQILSYFHYMKLTNHMFSSLFPKKVSILTQQSHEPSDTYVVNRLYRLQISFSEKRNWGCKQL